MKITTVGAAAVLLAVVCAVSLAVIIPSSDGETITHEGLIYETNDDGTLSVIGCVPDAVYGDVVIPSDIDGAAVTHIDDRIFSGTDVISVTIPSTVTSLYDQTTFIGCPTLERIDVDPENTVYSSINGVLFQGDRLLVVPAAYPVSDYTVPDGTASLNMFILQDNTTVRSITIPSSVTSIDPTSFTTGYALEEIVVDPDNTAYSSIDGVLCSKDGTRLISVPNGMRGGYTVPETVTTIGMYAFAFSGLSEVTVPDTVTAMETQVFINCDDLERISIGAGVTDIGVVPIRECPSLVGISVSKDNTAYRSDGVALYSADGTLVKLADGFEGEYAVIEGTTTLAPYSCSYIDGITSLTIPSSVTTLEYMAIFNCPGIGSIVFEGVPEHFGNLSLSLSDYENEMVCDIYIGENIDLSEYADNLTSFVYHVPGNHEGVHYSVVDGYAVADEIMDGNTDVTVADSVTIDGTEYTVTAVRFDGINEAVVSLTIPAGVEVSSTMFSGLSSLESIQTYGEGDLFTIDGVLFDGDVLLAYPASKDAGSYTVPDWVTAIGDCAFSNSYGLKGVILPDGLVSIGDSAFMASGIQEIVIPDSVTHIGESAFYYSWLTSADIGAGVTEIPQEAFAECDYMETLTGGENVTSIGDHAFYMCLNLEAFPYMPDLRSIGASAFENCRSLETFEIGPKVEGIGDCAFAKCEMIAEYVVDPDNGWYTAIGGVLFDRDVTVLISYPSRSSDTGYVVPDTVTEIGPYAFFNTSRLQTLTIPETVTAIGERAFDSAFLYVLTMPGDPDCVENAFDNAMVDELVFVDGEEVVDLSIIDMLDSLEFVSFPSSLTEVTGSTRMTFYIADADGALVPVTDVSAEVLAGRTFTCNGSELIAEDSATVVDGIRYKVTSLDDRTAEAYGYEDGTVDLKIAGSVEIGGVEYAVTSIADSAFAYFPGDGTLTIGENVLDIGDDAFLRAEVTGTVTIPSTATDIGYYAFAELLSVTAFEVADGNEMYCDIEGLLCTTDGDIIQCPSGMTGILRLEGDFGLVDGFEWSKLTGLEVDGNIYEIQSGAFQYSDIRYVTVTGEVGTVWTMAFRGSDLMAFHAAGLSEVMSGAFSDCYSLIHIYFPSTIEYIAPDAFYGYSDDIVFRDIWGNELEVSAESLGGRTYNLVSESPITLCEAVNPMTGMMFSDGTLLFSVSMGNEADVAGKISGLSLNVPDSYTFDGTEYSITGIGYLAFRGSDLTSLGDLGSVTTIGIGAFQGSDLEGALVIPESVRGIGMYAFADCVGITSIDLGNVETIDVCAFANMGGLESTTVTIPASTYIVSGDAFYRTFVTEYVVEEGNRLFTSVDGILYFDGALCDVPYGYTFGGAGYGTITIPADCRLVYAGALDCPFITGILVEEGNQHYTSVDGVLYTKDMTALLCCPANHGDLTIPEGVTDILSGAFVEPFMGIGSSWCVSFPESLEEIGSDFGFAIYSQDGPVVATAELLAGKSFMVQYDFLYPQVTVTVDSNFGGEVTGDGSYYVGQTAVVTVTPNSGYRVSEILVNGIEYDGSGPVEFLVLGDTTVEVTFIRTGGGSSTPDDGEDTTITENPDGSTTTTVTRPDGSSTSTTVKTDGSSTVTDTKPVTGGTQTTITEKDQNGNVTGSVTTTETERDIGGGSVSTVTVEETDADGDTVSRTESTYTSDDGATVTEVTVSVDADGNVVATSDTVISVPSGDTTVTADTVASAIEQVSDAEFLYGDLGKTVTVSVDGDGATFEPDALRAVADSGAGMTVKFGTGSIAITGEVMDNMSSGQSDVSLSMGPADESQMTSAQLEAVGDSPVFDLSAVSGGSTFHELGGEVRVSIPYILPEEADAGSVRVCYVDDDGTMHEMETSYEDDVVTFVTDHFSYFAIVSKSSAAGQSGEGSWDTVLIVAAVIIAVLIVATVVVAVRRRTT